MSLEPARPESFRRDVRVIGLVGFAHAFSHFFQLALPPLFPLLRAEFDVTWTLLGLLVGIFYGASALTQFGAGFVETASDRGTVSFGRRTPNVSQESLGHGGRGQCEMFFVVAALLVLAVGTVPRVRRGVMASRPSFGKESSWT